jgi:hypothetical protein
MAGHVERLKPVITVMGWIGFALVTADYAGFIDLPVLIQIPLWLAIVTSILRWALWEGLIKPRVKVPAVKGSDANAPLPPRDDGR